MSVYMKDIREQFEMHFTCQKRQIALVQAFEMV